MSVFSVSINALEFILLLHFVLLVLLVLCEAPWIALLLKCARQINMPRLSLSASVFLCVPTKFPEFHSWSPVRLSPSVSCVPIRRALSHALWRQTGSLSHWAVLVRLAMIRWTVLALGVFSQESGLKFDAYQITFTKLWCTLFVDTYQVLISAGSLLRSFPHNNTIQR